MTRRKGAVQSTLVALSKVLIGGASIIGLTSCYTSPKNRVLNNEEITAGWNTFVNGNRGRTFNTGGIERTLRREPQNNGFRMTYQLPINGSPVTVDLFIPKNATISPVISATIAPITTGGVHEIRSQAGFARRAVQAALTNSDIRNPSAPKAEQYNYMAPVDDALRRFFSSGTGVLSGDNVIDRDVLPLLHRERFAHVRKGRLRNNKQTYIFAKSQDATGSDEGYSLEVRGNINDQGTQDSDDDVMTSVIHLKWGPLPGVDTESSLHFGNSAIIEERHITLLETLGTPTNSGDALTYVGIAHKTSDGSAVYKHRIGNRAARKTLQERLGKKVQELYNEVSNP